MYIKVKAEGPEKKFIALSGEVRRVKTFRDIRQLAGGEAWLVHYSRCTRASTATLSVNQSREGNSNWVATGIGRAMSNSKKLSFVPCLVRNKVGQSLLLRDILGLCIGEGPRIRLFHSMSVVCTLSVCPKSMYPFMHLAFTIYDASCSFRIPLAGTNHVPRHVPELSSKPRKPNDGISSQFNDTYEFAKWRMETNSRSRLSPAPVNQYSVYPRSDNPSWLSCLTCLFVRVSIIADGHSVSQPY